MIIYLFTFLFEVGMEWYCTDKEDGGKVSPRNLERKTGKSGSLSSVMVLKTVQKLQPRTNVKCGTKQKTSSRDIVVMLGLTWAWVFFYFPAFTPVGTHNLMHLGDIAVDHLTCANESPTLHQWPTRSNTCLCHKILFRLNIDNSTKPHNFHMQQGYN